MAKANRSDLLGDMVRKYETKTADRFGVLDQEDGVTGLDVLSGKRSKVRVPGIPIQTTEAEPTESAVFAFDKSPVEEAEKVADVAIVSTASALKTSHEKEIFHPKTRQFLQGLQPGVLEQVDLSVIEDNPFNARAIYLAEQISEMASSLRAVGQLQPGIAIRRDGRYVLVAGHYRRRGLELAGITSMSLIVYPDVPDVRLFEISHAENRYRNSQTAIDDAITWRSLLDRGVYPSNEVLAAAIGYSSVRISKTLAAMRLNEETVSIVRSNPDRFPLDMLYEITLLQKVAGDHYAKQYAEKVVNEGLLRKDVVSARHRLEGKRTESEPVVRKDVASRFNLWRKGVKVGDIRYRMNGEIVLRVALTDPEENKGALEELRRIFDFQSREAPEADPKPIIGEKVDPLTWQPVAEPNHQTEQD